MKFYFFNVETGLYEGETYGDADMIAHIDGITTVPPSNYGNGQVPIYDSLTRSWDVISLSIARQRLKFSLNEPTLNQT